MGAHNFITYAKGKTPAEAYKNACDEGRDENGHQDGYSGDIQTTRGFAMVTVPAGVALDRAKLDSVIDEILHNNRNRYGIEKWGKAGCIAMGADEYLFFGWAAS